MKLRTGLFISFVIHIAVFCSAVLVLNIDSKNNTVSNIIEFPVVLYFSKNEKSKYDFLKSDSSSKNKTNYDSKKSESKSISDVKAYVKNRIDYLAKNDPPVYPEFCRRNNLEGEVVLAIEVLKNGRTGKIEVVENTGHRFFKEAAVEAAKNWDIVTKSGYQLEEDIRIIKKIYFKIRG